MATCKIRPSMITLNDANCFISEISSTHSDYSSVMTTEVKLVLYGDDQREIFNHLTSSSLHLQFEDNTSEMDYLHKYLEYRGLEVEFNDFKNDMKGIERI